AKRVEGSQRLVIGHGDVLGTAAVLEPGVLRADTGIVQAGRDGVRLADLSVRVLQEIRAVAMQHAGPARAQRRRVLAGLEPFAAWRRTSSTPMYTTHSMA